MAQFEVSYSEYVEKKVIVSAKDEREIRVKFHPDIASCLSIEGASTRDFPFAKGEKLWSEVSLNGIERRDK